ncbi:conserved exported hypothetical protein [Luteimonas sp. 9C]|nr:conserved exported hypothetical protein [Luteimonas sp. 9C]
MIKRAAACLLLAALASSVPASVPTRANVEPAASAIQGEAELHGLRFESLLHEGLERQDAGDALAASQAFTRAIERPEFDALAPEVRHAILHQAAGVAIDAGQLQTALRQTQSALRLRQDEADDWYRLAALQTDLGNANAAADALRHLLTSWPEIANDLPQYLIVHPIFVTRADDDLRLALLDALFDANWTGNGIGSDPAWIELALLRLERRDASAARAAIARVHQPMDIIRLRADRRFDAIVDRDDPRFDVAAAAEAHLDAVRRLTLERPDRLELRTTLITALLATGRVDEALTTADDALADLETFSDPEDAVWVHNQRAIALRRLGRDEDAIATLTVASNLHEGGGLNVSQVLNLGTLHTILGQPDEALAAIERVGHDITGYGRMVEESVRFRAAIQQGDTEMADLALAQLALGRTDAPQVYLEALLMRGDLDAAAAALAGLLETPVHRQTLLDWAQTYRVLPPAPGEVTLRQHRARFLARADVQDVISRYGRIEAHPVYAARGIE